MRAIKLSAVLIAASLLCGSGWNDYSLDLGGGYRIVRANSFDISLCKESDVVVGPWTHRGIGPLYEYAQIKGYIFTKHYGAKTRDASGTVAEWRILDVDHSITHYFIVRTADGSIQGPLTHEQFERERGLLGLQVTRWKSPRNPNVILPFIGSIWFILVSIPFLAIKNPLYVFVALLMIGSAIITVVLLARVLIKRP